MKKINQRNRKRLANNRTGVNGVCFHVTSNNSGGYNEYLRVVWVENGKQKKKDFNIKQFPSREARHRIWRTAKRYGYS